MRQTDEEENTGFKDGQYKKFWQIAQDEGGLMNKEFGIMCAMNYCKMCEQKGNGAVTYDGGTRVVQYLHFKSGINERVSRLRQQMLTAVVDLPSDIVISAMQNAEKSGLSTTVPKEMLGKLDDMLPGKLEVPTPSVPITSGDTPPDTRRSNSSAATPKPAAPTPDSAAPANDAAVATDADMMESIHLAVGLKPGDAPNANQQVMIQSLIMMRQSEQQKEEAEKSKLIPVPPPKERRHKTELEEQFSEATLLGKKLGGTIRHAESITKQIQTPGNFWNHAVNDLPKLETALNSVRPAYDQAETTIATSSLDVFRRKVGTDANGLVWLGEHIESLHKVTELLQEPLRTVLKIHSIRLKELAMEGKGSQPKKKTGKKKA